MARMTITSLVSRGAFPFPPFAPHREFSGVDPGAVPDPRGARPSDPRAHDPAAASAPGADPASVGVAPMGAAGWSVQSFTFADAGGVRATWTVVGSGAGQAAVEPLGPPTHPGTPGHEVVAGGLGRDTVAGGLGDDVLVGGAGADTFVYAVGDGRDTIADFERGVDRLVILGAPGLTIVSNGGAAVVLMPDGGQIALHSVSAVPAADNVLLG